MDWWSLLHFKNFCVVNLFRQSFSHIVILRDTATILVQDIIVLGLKLTQVLLQLDDFLISDIG